MNRTPLSYIFVALFSAALAVTSNNYLFSQLQPADVACTKSTANAVVTASSGDVAADDIGVAQSSSTKNNATLFEEKWNQIKQMSCPKQIPNPSIWPVLYEQARIELGFDMETIPNTPKDLDFITNFFTFCNGGVGYTSSDEEHHLVYLKIWKAANDHIRKNIGRVVARKKDVWEFEIPMNVYGNKNRDYSGLWSPIPLSKRNQTCVVTAVRDPVEHFLSAYNEIEFRSTDSFLRSHGVKDHKKQQLYYERYENGSDARFERYVSEFIFGASSTGLFPSRPVYSNIFHAFSQTGVLWLLKQQKDLTGVNSPRLVAYLPSIYNVSATFPNLIKTNCPGFELEFGRPFSKKFDHPSQKDQNGFYAAAKRVWSKQGATSRALCALHLMDYACFDLIPIPDLCQDVFSDASFNDRLLTQPSTTPPTSHQGSKETMTSACNFCEGGIVDPELLVPKTGGLTCVQVKAAATKEVNGTATCRTVQKEEEECCPTKRVGDSHA
eukprot:scaffold1778_cov135-Skeletonema_menzelii.AAC.12